MTEVLPRVTVANPDWVREAVDFERSYTDDVSRMRVAIGLARTNVERRTGGPFGAAIFEEESGRLVAVGVNMVVPSNNCVLHGEMVAYMMAQARLGTFTLAAPGLPDHVIFTSCEPCAMCLGATLWSGVTRVAYAATGEDAAATAFDEGPVMPASYAYLEERGVRFTRELLRAEGRAVLELYRDSGGLIYNG